MPDIVGKRNYFFALSIILILAGLVGYIVNGVKMDIQFEGGTLIQIEMKDDNFEPAKAEAIVMDTVHKTAKAQKLKTANATNQNQDIHLLILKISKSETLSDKELNQVLDALKANMNVKEDANIDVQNVEPFIGRELLNKGILAVVISSILIILYVWWRFSVMSGLSAAVMAVLALLHDALIMLSVYVIFRIPLNESFIAAVLTMLGYSLNDTIIIYDRIRENSKLIRKTDTFKLVNTSIVQTLTRSINTVVTVLISIITVYVYASVYNIGSLKEFSLPLIVGITSGCYSSIFIASPLWAMWKEHKAKKKIRLKSAKA